ncbi:hypothetical protein CY35_05G000600 [Sphagnum magellanicum]|nr:hypothetical protein CY35_05G000600 [Sphagnum magellanicum]
MAEVRNPKTRKRIWIGDFSTRQAAALAADVGAVYYGTGKDVLNFQHTPRFLPRTLEYSSVKEKVEAVRKEARLLRETPPKDCYHHHTPLEIAGCHGRLTTIFPSPIPTAVEVSLFPLPMSNCQNCNCGFQTGSVELNEDLQVHNNLTPIQGNSMLRLTSEDLMHGSIETMEWANKGLDAPPVSVGSNWQLTCMSGVSSRLPLPFTYQTMSCPSWIVVGDAPSECNTMAVPCPCPGEQAPDTLEYDERHPHETPVESDHAATMLLSSQLAEFMDSNEGEGFTTLLETEKCDQRGYIRDHIFQLEEMPRHDLEVCNLDIDDTVLLAIAGPKEANETSSWHIHESLTEPPQPFVFSSQPFVQFDEYLY